MAAPKVQTLDQILSGYAPGYAAQKTQYQKMMEQNKTNKVAKQDALKAQQAEDFKGIEQTASNKGMLFSGFSPDQQARYNATKFMPALAALDQETIAANNQLALALAGLDTDARNRAMADRQRQKDQLFSWQEAERQRQFQAEQNRLQRQAEERRQAQQLAAQRASQASSQPSLSQRLDAMLQASVGRDGKVSPSTWRNLVAYAHRNGMSFGGSDGFANQFWNYANNKHWQDYKLGYDRYMR